MVDCAYDCRSPGKRERPFQFQLGHVGGREARAGRVLESRVVGVLSPAGPSRTRVGIECSVPIRAVHIAAGPAR